MKKIFLSLILGLCFVLSPLFGQIPTPPPPSYEDLISKYLGTNSRYFTVSNQIMTTLKNNKQLNALYEEGIKTFDPRELQGIMNNYSKILEYTTNESIILMTGVSIAAMEAISAQNEINSIMLDRFQKRLGFLTSSGNNYGMIMPLYFPLGSLSISAYMDMPTKLEKLKEEFPKSEYYDYSTLAYAMDSVPLPYLQATGQINLWTLPMSLAFRGGVLMGFKGLYKQFVTDVDIASSGYILGAELKGLLFRTEYFFADLRANFNYNKGNFETGFNQGLYVPLTVGFKGGTETGVVFDGEPSMKAKWQAMSISPKLTVGFKVQERIPVIQYFGLSFSAGYDFSFVDTEVETKINSVSAYANIVGNSKVVDDLLFPIFNESGKYQGGEPRISLTMDIFYFSFMFEYGIFSKRYSILFTPFVIRL